MKENFQIASFDKSYLVIKSVYKSIKLMNIFRKTVTVMTTSAVITDCYDGEEESKELLGSVKRLNKII